MGRYFWIFLQFDVFSFFFICWLVELDYGRLDLPIHILLVLSATLFFVFGYSFLGRFLFSFSFIIRR